MKSLVTLSLILFGTTAQAANPVFKYTLSDSDGVPRPMTLEMVSESPFLYFDYAAGQLKIRTAAQAKAALGVTYSDIVSGSINGVAIGNTTPSTGAFSTLNVATAGTGDGNLLSFRGAVALRMGDGGSTVTANAAMQATLFKAVSATGALELGNPADVKLIRDGANILALRNGSNAQSIRLGPSGSYFSIYDTGGGGATLQASGTNQNINLTPSGSGYINTNGNGLFTNTITTTSDLRINNTNAGGAIFLNATSGKVVVGTGTVGATSPMLKRSGQNIEFRLSNDSDYTNITAKAANLQAISMSGDISMNGNDLYGGFGQFTDGIRSYSGADLRGGPLVLRNTGQSTTIFQNAVGVNAYVLGRSVGADDAQDFFLYNAFANRTEFTIDSSGNFSLGGAINSGGNITAANLTTTGQAQSGFVLTNQVYFGNGDSSHPRLYYSGISLMVGLGDGSALAPVVARNYVAQGQSEGLKLVQNAAYIGFFSNDGTTRNGYLQMNASASGGDTKLINEAGGGVNIGTNASIYLNAGTGTKFSTSGLFSGGSRDPGDGSPAGVRVGYEAGSGYIDANQTGIAAKPLSIQASGGSTTIGGGLDVFGVFTAASGASFKNGLAVAYAPDPGTYRLAIYDRVLAPGNVGYDFGVHNIASDRTSFTIHGANPVVQVNDRVDLYDSVSLKDGITVTDPVGNPLLMADGTYILGENGAGLWNYINQTVIDKYGGIYLTTSGDGITSAYGGQIADNEGTLYLHYDGRGLRTTADTQIIGTDGQVFDYSTTHSQSGSWGIPIAAGTFTIMTPSVNTLSIVRPDRLGITMTIISGQAYAHTLTGSGGARFYSGDFANQTTLYFNGAAGASVTLKSMPDPAATSIYTWCVVTRSGVGNNP